MEWPGSGLSSVCWNARRYVGFGEVLLKIAGGDRILGFGVYEIGILSLPMSYLKCPSKLIQNASSQCPPPRLAFPPLHRGPSTLHLQPPPQSLESFPLPLPSAPPDRNPPLGPTARSQVPPPRKPHAPSYACRQQRPGERREC